MLYTTLLHILLHTDAYCTLRWTGNVFFSTLLLAMLQTALLHTTACSTSNCYTTTPLHFPHWCILYSKLNKNLYLCLSCSAITPWFWNSLKTENVVNYNMCFTKLKKMQLGNVIFIILNSIYFYGIFYIWSLPSRPPAANRKVDV